MKVLKFKNKDLSPKVFILLEVFHNRVNKSVTYPMPKRTPKRKLMRVDCACVFKTFPFFFKTFCIFKR